MVHHWFLWVKPLGSLCFMRGKALTTDDASFKDYSVVSDQSHANGSSWLEMVDDSGDWAPPMGDGQVSASKPAPGAAASRLLSLT